VLGFLSVSTAVVNGYINEGLCFNPVLGFLSVSTKIKPETFQPVLEFQSRAGFSECLDDFAIHENRDVNVKVAVV